MNAANGEGDDIGSCRSLVMLSAHKVLSEGHLSVEVEMKSHAPALAAKGPAASPASESKGVNVGGVIVVVRHDVGYYWLYVRGYFCVFVWLVIGTGCYMLLGVNEPACIV
jgi:hypothetical protein